MTWTVAADIADRIRKLRSLLGGEEGKPILQEELAQRAGVRKSQVSQWERGAQRPSRSRLERWAEREKWPVEIFREGAPMPSEILSDSVDVGGPGPVSFGAPDLPSTDPNQILARFYEVLAEASRGGSPPPPELALLIQQMHGIAVGAEDKEASSEAAGPPPGSEEDPEVPDW